MKELNELHINRLYQFTREHFVEFYDVQTELVDHLANDIEQQWLEDKSLEFEQALKIAFKRFGIFGFNDVVQKKHKAIKFMYWKELWKFSKQYYKLPKIVLTILSMYALYEIITRVNSAWFLASLLAVEVMLMFLGLRSIKNFKLKGHEDKKFVLQINLRSFYVSTAGSLTLNQLNFFLLALMPETFYSDQFVAVTCAIMTVVFFTIYHALRYQLPSSMKRAIESHFPRLKTV